MYHISVFRGNGDDHLGVQKGKGNQRSMSSRGVLRTRCSYPVYRIMRLRLQRPMCPPIPSTVCSSFRAEEDRSRRFSWKGHQLSIYPTARSHHYSQGCIRQEELLRNVFDLAEVAQRVFPQSLLAIFPTKLPTLAPQLVP